MSAVQSFMLLCLEFPRYGIYRSVFGRWRCTETAVNWGRYIRYFRYKNIMWNIHQKDKECVILCAHGIPLTYGIIPGYYSLSKVFGSFEATHERSADLEKLYQALLTIAPTSVSSERAFSIAGNFLTRRRARIKDGTVDNLCFLQSYFANNSKEKNSK